MLKTALGIFLFIVSYLLVFGIVLSIAAIALGYILGFGFSILVLPILPLLYSIWQIFKYPHKRNYFFLFLNNLGFFLLLFITIDLNRRVLDYFLPYPLWESYEVAIFPLIAYIILVICWLKVQALILDRGEKPKRKYEKAKNDFSHLDDSTQSDEELEETKEGKTKRRFT